ncbi:MAG: hypothetical protein ISP90_18040 [Nevskia sp.]|nr:hypothetical protein [Nevskia sp.]
MDETITRWEAAIAQLDAALACYEQGNFLPAITLGAAAEELLSKELTIRRPDLRAAREADKNVLEFFQDGTLTESKSGKKDIGSRKVAAIVLGTVQNFLKHASTESLSFDPEFEAADRLQRSLDMHFWMTGNATLRDDWNHRIRFLHKKIS